MGAVLRSTCILPAIKRQYPNSHITWLTMPISKGLLEHNPFIDRLLTVDALTISLLDALKFDTAYGVDKSIGAGSLLRRANAKEKYGFSIDDNGVIVPVTRHAIYQYDVGLNDELKFKINQKTETQQLHESLNLEWKRDPYVINFSDAEKSKCAQVRSEILDKPEQRLIGINTGCSKLYPYKKFTVARTIELVAALREAFPADCVCLLGGPEDYSRQQSIKAAFSSDRHVHNSPTNEGVRTGLVWMSAVDLVFSGCSLGLHMAIALRKPTVCWFGVSCHQEIDLYDKGIKLLADVPCSPCWRKTCDNEPKCFDRVDPERVVSAIKKLMGNEVEKDDSIGMPIKVAGESLSRLPRI